MSCCVKYQSMASVQVVHIFSHIHQTYVVYSARIGAHAEAETEQRTCWLTDTALQEAAVSTGVKKVCVCMQSLIAVYVYEEH